MTTWFEHLSKEAPAADPDTVELTLGSGDRLIEHVDSSTIVEGPRSREEFMEAYEEAIRRQE